MKGTQTMDKTRLYHALDRLEEANLPDSEKVILLVSIIKDVVDRLSILEADVDVLTEGLNKGLLIS
jgi:hypothetical protein